MLTVLDYMLLVMSYLDMIMSIGIKERTQKKLSIHIFAVPGIHTVLDFTRRASVVQRCIEFSKVRKMRFNCVWLFSGKSLLFLNTLTLLNLI